MQTAYEGGGTMKLWILAPNGVMTAVVAAIRSEVRGVANREIADAIYAINYMIVHRVNEAISGKSFETEISYRDAAASLAVDLIPYKVYPQEYYARIGRVTPLTLSWTGFIEAMSYYGQVGWDSVIQDLGDYRNPILILTHFNRLDYEKLSRKFALSV